MRIGIDIKILLAMAEKDAKSPRVSVNWLARKLKYSEGTIYRRLAVLKKEGMVAVEEGYGNNQKYFYIPDRYQLEALTKLYQILNRNKDIEGKKRKR